MNAEDYKAGYRAGFEAGHIKALQESAATLDLTVLGLTAPELPARRQRPADPRRRRGCGRVDTTHNELGYCQARGARYSDGCHCSGFDRAAPVQQNPTGTERQ